ncbi:MAG: glycoside hydrolase family 11 protein [Oscillospiraceae bacterium]|jgi:hypothetical protein|nr:glycoside hydrolase family 11 protein [Oscillospiraceae bacterium]
MMSRILKSLAKNSIILLIVSALLIGLMPLMTNAAEVVISVDFEDGTPMGFSVQGTDAERERGAGEISVVTDLAHSGSHSLLITDRRQNWNGPSFDIFPYIQADVTYTISFWVHAKSPDVSDFTLSTQTGSLELGTARSWDNLASATISVDDGWVEISAIHYYSAADMEKGFISVYIENADSDAEYYIDDFTVTAVDGGAWNPKTDLIENVSRRAGTFEGFDFEFWTEISGDGTMMLTGGGTFWVTWDGRNVLGRMGQRLGSMHTYDKYGEIIVDYAGYLDVVRGDVTFLCLYGWTQHSLGEYSLVEWYVIEEHGSYKPGRDFIDDIYVDGEWYEVWTNIRRDEPSIEGTQTFLQIYSIRKEHRNEGSITLSDHFKEWERLGLDMSGNLYEVALCIEGFRGEGRGAITHHELTIGSPDDHTPSETPDTTESPTPSPTPDNSNTNGDDNNGGRELTEGEERLAVILGTIGGLIVVGAMIALLVLYFKKRKPKA